MDDQEPDISARYQHFVKGGVSRRPARVDLIDVHVEQRHRARAPKRELQTSRRELSLYEHAVDGTS